MSDHEFPVSTRDWIARLRIGESHAVCRKLAFEGATREALTTAATEMRNTLNKAMRRAMDLTGNTCRIETAETVGREHIFVFVVVTRTE